MNINQQRTFVKTIICPFNKNHVIAEQKFINHVYKCQKNNLQQIRFCKYNNLHVFNKDFIQEHQNKCKDRSKQSSEEIWDVQKLEDKSYGNGNKWDSQSEEKQEIQKQKRMPDHKNKKLAMQPYMNDQLFQQKKGKIKQIDEIFVDNDEESIIEVQDF